jgi:hypothetical protein
MKILPALAACLCLAFVATACAPGGPPPPIEGPFDGIWTSPHLGYDFIISGPKGRAISSSRATIHRDDVVFEITGLGEDVQFSGKQLLPDGAWHAFTGELKPDGRIACTDGKSSWVLERRP